MERTEASILPGEILIVEDSSVEAELLRRTLVTAGYAVRIAYNGAEGLRAARVNHPALVLSDINMPVMNGFELCRALKFDEELWNIPLILLTVLSEPKDIIEAINSGADAYIIKPYIEATLLERIRFLLETPIARPRTEERRKEVVGYGGERHTIAGGGQQILNLLLSLYENALNQNRELEEAKNQLSLMNENLDRQVQERTVALTESEQRYKRIAEGVTDYLYTVRIENGRAAETVQSAASLVVTGYSPEEFTADPYLWIQMVVPEDRELVHEHVRQILSGEDSPPLEHRIIRKDGKVCWISDTAILNRDPTGKLISYDGLIKDITARKAAEQKILVSELRYRRLFESAKDGILILDAETGLITDVNPFLLEILGYPYEELIGKQLWELGFFSNIVSSKENFVTLQQKSFIRYEDLPLRTSGGKELHVEFVSNVYLVGNRRVIQCNIRDITERRGIRLALQNKEKQLTEALAIARIGYWEYEFSTDEFIFNDQYYSLHRITAEEAGGYRMSMADFVNRYVDPDDAPVVGQNVRLAFESPDPDYSPRIEVRILSGKGEIIWVDVRFRIQRDEKGNTIGLIGINQDITERKETESILAGQLDELRRWHATTLGREGRILELKREVNELLGRTGEPPRYRSAESPEAKEE